MKKLSLILCILGFALGAIMGVVTKNFVTYSTLSFVFAVIGAVAGIIISESAKKKGFIKKAASVIAAEIGIVVIVAIALPILKANLPAANTVAPVVESKSYQSVSNNVENNSNSVSYGNSGSSSSSNYYSSSPKSSSSSSVYSSGSSNYDYDKGYGYTAPKEGESFSDYVKRQDPELYKSMKDIYDSLD